jgi:secondary thiamine-phosphate synthase enzyme
VTPLKELVIRTSARGQMKDITADVNDALASSPSPDGLCVVFVPHTTAAVTVNESADPAVRTDILAALDRAVPRDAGYGHDEGNSDSHVKSSLFGPSLTLLFSGRRLVLGRWQAVYFCEFDGPRTRKVVIHAVPD